MSKDMQIAVALFAGVAFYYWYSQRARENNNRVESVTPTATVGPVNLGAILARRINP